MAIKRDIVRPTSSEPIISSYLNQKGCKLGLPISGNFELTARCNFDCKMCYVHLKENVEELKKRELTADQWLSIASDARDRGLIFLLLTGGEPFIRKDFPKIYTELIKMGMMISINTNASLFNDELRHLFRQYPPTRINVTLYGGSEDTYRNLCGNASFKRVVDNIRKMKEDRLQVRLNVTLTPSNVRDMEAIHNVSKEFGLQAKATSYMYPPVRITGEIGNNAERFNPIEAGQIMAKWNQLRDTEEIFLERAKRIQEQQRTEEKDSCVDGEQEGIMCRAGRSSFWMTWDGGMLPCGTMNIDASYPLRDGFDNAWNEVRERVSLIRFPKECTSCNYRKNCGVCAANCKSETGEFEKKPEYICSMTKSQCKTTLKMAEKARL